MRKQDEDEKLIKTPTAKRSLFLTIMGAPMICVAALGKDNLVCLILSVVYIIALFLNGIFSLPLIMKFIHKQNKTK